MTSHSLQKLILIAMAKEETETMANASNEQTISERPDASDCWRCVVIQVSKRRYRVGWLDHTLRDGMAIYDATNPKTYDEAGALALARKLNGIQREDADRAA